VPKSQSTEVTAAENAEEPAKEEDFLAMLEQFLIDERCSTIDNQEEYWDTEDQFIEDLEQFLIAEGESSNDEKDQFVDFADMAKKTDLNCAYTMAGNLETFNAEIKDNVNVQAPGSNGGGAAEVPEGADTAPVDKGGADRVQVPIAAGGGGGTVHTDEGGVMAKADDCGGHVHAKVPTDDGGDAASVQAEEESNVAKNDADDGVGQANTDEGGGAVQVTERGDLAKVPMKTELCPTEGRDNILRFDKSVDGGGDANVHIPDQYDNGEDDMINVVTDQSTVDVIVPGSDGGGAASVEPEEGGDVAYDVVDTGDDNVHTHIDEGGGAFQVTENRAVTKYDGGGGVHDCVFDEHDHVDDEAEFTKEIGPVACSRSVMREPVKKSPPVKKKQVREVPPVRHDDVQDGGILPNHHDDADQDRGAQHADDGDAAPGQEDGGDDAVCVQADQGPGAIQSSRTVVRKPVKKSPPVQQKHVQESPPERHDDVHEGGEQGHHDAADREQGVPHANEGDGTVNAPVEKEVDLTKVVEDQGDVHVPAHIDEGGGAGEMKPEVDKDGGDVPTPEDKKDGKLGIIMTKPERFAHGGGGGIAKSTRLCSCAFLLVVNTGKLGPRDRSQVHFTGAT
jgi:hypothetical protein